MLGNLSFDQPPLCWPGAGDDVENICDDGANSANTSDDLANYVMLGLDL